ncbi:MAG: patatin-like phospholipase family protein [bacterium]|nr:patatin-like phospholipase family protein [bacterium]
MNKKAVKEKSTSKKSTKKKTEFKSVIFAGGGSRCIWEIGFWDVAAPALKIKPDVVAGVSAGATMACMIFSGKSGQAIEYFQDMTEKNEKNVYFSNFFKKDMVMPHYNMYMNAILETIDTKALKKLQKGPEIRILLARPPRYLGPRSATLIGFSTYSLEKKISNPVHPVYASKLGYKPEVVSIKDCNTPQELADLLLQSSCTPPMVPILRRDNKVVLDGGLIDNVPVAALDENELANKETLVLLTRQYPEESIPKIPGRTYVQPSEPISITKWDYTNPEGLQTAYELGQRDAETFVSKVTGE